MKQSSPPRTAISWVGRRSRRPSTTTAEPARAAEAYSSPRRTAGTSETSTSRNMPPPTPVRTPNSIAPTGFSPTSTALSVPETAKSERPAASSTSTELRSRRMIGAQKNVRSNKKKKKQKKKQKTKTSRGKETKIQ